MDPNAYTLPFQLTKTMRRDLYPALEPSNAEISASGKIVIITGAGGTVGSACAVAWSIAGATGIVLVGRNVDALSITAEKIASMSRSTKVLIQSTDFTLEASVKALYDKIETQLVKADVLINSAGSMNFHITGDVKPSVWWQDYVERAQSSTISSGAAGIVVPGFSSYNTSKLAITKITEFLQVEHPELRVFTCLSGILKSNMTAESFLPFAKDDSMLTGGMTLYLSTPKADFLRGRVVSVNCKRLSRIERIFELLAFAGDVEEMEKHKEEMMSKGLIKTAYLFAKLGAEGHPWES